MKIKILSKGVELDRELEQYIKTKIDFLESKLGLARKNEERVCNFRMGRDTKSKKKGNIYFAEASIETPRKNFGARAEADSIQMAIDELKDELYKKIRRYKRKKEAILRRRGRIGKRFLRIFVK